MSSVMERGGSRGFLPWLLTAFVAVAASAAGQEQEHEREQEQPPQEEQEHEHEADADDPHGHEESEAVREDRAAHPHDHEEEEETEFAHTHSESVVVTASRIQQEFANAPSTISVIRAAQIDTAGSPNVGDVLRRVPGVNVVQLANRDYNVSTRTPGGVLASSQLVLVDGRSVYQDFYGFVAWDLIPHSLQDIDRLEVVRGPASSVWGPNAMHGVTNLITKAPRDSVGTTLDFNFGFFDRNVPGRDGDRGNQFGVSVSHADAPTDRFAYRASIGYTQQDGFARPFGNIPNDFGTQYPVLEPAEARLPKASLRLDFQTDEHTRIKLTGGFAGTSGILHTGIGPYEFQDGARMSFGRVQYERDSIEIAASVNATNAGGDVLLLPDASGASISTDIDTYNYDVSFRDTRFLSGNHLLSYGANARLITLNFGLAPDGDRRDEQGVYIQDEIFFNERFRWIIGGRADRLSVLDDIVLSPRTTLLFKPTPHHVFRASFNRAFQSPSLIQNFLRVENGQPFTVDLRPAIQGQLGAIQIPEAALPAPVRYLAPFSSRGNADLKPETLTAWEIGYSGDIGHRVGVSAAVYLNDLEDTIDFTESGFWSTANPPPGWNEAFAEVGDFITGLTSRLPPGTIPPAFAAIGQNEAVLIDLLGATADVRLPSGFSYVNREFIRNVGFEVGIDAALAPEVNGFVNYSWQEERESRGWNPDDLNIAPSHRFNVGIDVSTDLIQAGANLNYTGRGFWADVLTERFHGWTEAFTMVNGSVGVNLLDGRISPEISVVNLLNQDIQQHIFGDILKRQIIGSVRFQF